MMESLTGLAPVAGLVAVMASLVYLAKRIRRQGSAGAAIGAAMAAYDEAMHPGGHAQFVEVQAQRDRKVAMTADAALEERDSGAGG